MIWLEPGMIVSYPKIRYGDGYSVRLLTEDETLAIKKKCLKAIDEALLTLSTKGTV